MPAIACEVCGELAAWPATTSAEFEYKDAKRQVQLSGHRCESCGSEYANAEDLRANKRLRLAFEKETDGLLTGAAVRAIRNKLKLTQEEAAAVFGGGRVAFSKYESDDVAQSVAMDRLLRLLDRMPAALGVLKEIAGIQPATNPAGHLVLSLEEYKAVRSASPSYNPVDVPRSNWALSESNAIHWEWNDQPDPSTWVGLYLALEDRMVAAASDEGPARQVRHTKASMSRSFSKGWGSPKVIDTVREKQ